MKKKFENVNVLSLFDGIACGKLALERAGITINKYYASEIKPTALKLINIKQPDIIQLGDVKNIKASDLPKIDLLIGGSPCQDFSVANNERKGLEGEKSSLFYEYLRLLKEVNPTYFLLENVSMAPDQEAIITNLLGVHPIVIDSLRVTGAHRKRLYWTNIPNVQQPKYKEIYFQDILDSGWTDRKKARCLLAGDSRPMKTPVKMFRRYLVNGFTNVVFKDEKHYWDCFNHYTENYGGGKKRKGIPAEQIKCDSDVYDGLRYINKEESARLQTVPEDYIDCLEEKEALDVLGDGWTVDVVAHIFSYINKDSKSDGRLF